MMEGYGGLHVRGIPPPVLRGCDSVGVLERSHEIGVVVESASVDNLSEAHLCVSVKQALGFLDFDSLDIYGWGVVREGIYLAIELPAAHAHSRCNLRYLHFLSSVELKVYDIRHLGKETQVGGTPLRDHLLFVVLMCCHHLCEFLTQQPSAV